MNPALAFEGSVTELRQGEMIVGSARDAGLRLQNQDLAPHHFAVVVEGNRAVVRPHSARHLVSVNGRAIADASPLSDGDVIAAGEARLRFLKDSRSPAAGRSLPDESAWLRSLDGSVAYTLARRTLQIGRDAGSNIQLKDPDVSRHHADIRGEAGLHVLHSMGALGTKVNGDSVEHGRILLEGDRIDIGEAAFIYTRTPPEPGTRITSGGDEYDLEVSQQLTGRQRKLMDSPGKALNSPKVLRVAAVIVAVMAVMLVVLLFVV
jgi:pSer/pThr/pTyr-binding forkhead associated (FHA) protein